MDEHHIELARQAVAVVRDVLAGRGLPTSVSTVLDRTTHSLVVFLLASCGDPEDIENELDRLDVELTDQLADTLLKDIDWDAQSWSG
jgi:hypothetical protein